MTAACSAAVGLLLSVPFGVWLLWYGQPYSAKRAGGEWWTVSFHGKPDRKMVYEPGFGVMDAGGGFYPIKFGAIGTSVACVIIRAEKADAMRARFGDAP